MKLIAAHRDIGDKDGLAFTLMVLGAVAQAQENDARATVLHEESLGLWTAIGFKWGKATALYAESLVLRQELVGKHGLAECLEGLGG